MIKSRSLEYLIAVEQYGHFGKAARHCHVTQPTLSVQIRKLEEYLNVQIFQRGRRGTTPTLAGQEVLVAAKRVMYETNAMEALRKTDSDPTNGLRTLGMFPTIAPYMLPSLLPHLRNKYPHLRLHIVEEKSAVLLDKLNDLEIDMALLALPQLDEGLSSFEVWSEPFLLAVPRDHSLTSQQEIRVDMLKNENLMLLDEGHCFREQALEICKTIGARENQAYRSASLETLKQMVAVGLGITLIPQMACLRSDENICYIPFADPVPERRIGLVCRSGSPQLECWRKLSLALSNLCKEHFSG